MKKIGREAHLKSTDSELERNFTAPSLLSQKRKLLRYQWYPEVRGRAGAKSMFSCPSLHTALTIINKNGAKRESPRMRRAGEPSLDCGGLFRRSWSSSFASATRATNPSTALNSGGCSDLELCQEQCYEEGWCAKGGKHKVALSLTSQVNIERLCQ